MKKTVYIILFTLLAAQLVGQENIDPQAIGNDTSQQSLKEISITKFENTAFWRGSIPLESGIIQLRKFEGGPSGKEPLEEESEVGIEEQDRYVLAAKVKFLKRGIHQISIESIRPLPVEGIAKVLSVWVVGRNRNHILNIVISDYFGNKAVLEMGRLNFSGWQQMTAAIPASLQQGDPYRNSRGGLFIEGFLIETNIDESFGEYYIYFDDLRAVTDLFAFEVTDPDDMSDGW